MNKQNKNKNKFKKVYQYFNTVFCCCCCCNTLHPATAWLFYEKSIVVDRIILTLIAPPRLSVANLSPADIVSLSS